MVRVSAACSRWVNLANITSFAIKRTHKMTTQRICTHRIFALMPVSKSVALTCSTVVPEGRKREKEKWCHWLKLESSTNFHRIYCSWNMSVGQFTHQFLTSGPHSKKKFQHVFISEIGTRTRCSALCIRMNNEKVQHFFSILFLLVGCVSQAHNRLRNCTFPLFVKSESIECVHVCVVLTNWRIFCYRCHVIIT